MLTYPYINARLVPTIAKRSDGRKAFKSQLRSTNPNDLLRIEGFGSMADSDKAYWLYQKAK